MLQLCRSWYNAIKKNNKMNTEKLISLKENFTGQKFQWIKTDRPELLGKCVKCRDVQPFGARFMVTFDDGSKIDSSRLNSDLLMLHGDMEPLSRSEVESISGAKIQKPTQPTAQPTVQQPVVSTGPTFNQPQMQQPVIEQQTTPKPNMFAMFNSEESQISVNLTVKLPDRKLLKLMYTSAEDKDKFLSELAEYLHGMINKQVVKDSMHLVLAPPVIIKRENKPTINLTEVDESRR